MNDVCLASSNAESTRIVFLIDVAMGRLQNVSEKQRLSRAVTLASTRTLLYLSSFPHSKYKDKLKWNYTFYDSQQTDWSLRTRAGNFLELTTCQIESYSRDVMSRLSLNTTKCVKAVKPVTSLLYNALATAIQDYPWDAPFIVSPVRSNTPAQKRTKQTSSVEKEQSNMLLVFSYCPTSKRDLESFCGLQDSKIDIDVDTIKSKLFSEDLLSLVTKKNVRMYFVNCTDLTKQAKSEDMNGLALYSEVISKSTGGKLLALSQLVCPVDHNLLHRNLSPDYCLSNALGNCSAESSHSNGGRSTPRCVLTYPVQTSLSKRVSQEDSICSCKHSLLRLLADGQSVCIVEVHSMLRSSSPSLMCLSRDGEGTAGLSSPASCSVESEIAKAEVIGVIQTSNINLSWLHPNKVYTCVGIGCRDNQGNLSYSRYFQTLNLWMAANRSALVLKMSTITEHAVLQPITALVSSLTFVKPEHAVNMCDAGLVEKRLFPVDSASSDQSIDNEGVSPDNTFVPLEADFCVDLCRLSSTSESDSEAATVNSSKSFTVQSFHPCSLYLPASGVLSNEFYAQLNQLSKAEEKNHDKILNAFHESLCKTSLPDAGEIRVTTTVQSKVPENLSHAEATGQFKSIYQQCIESDKNEEQLFESLTEAIRKLECVLSSDELLQFFDKNMLLNHGVLRAKHEATQGAAAEKQKINEYLLQALLYLEAHKRGLRDHLSVAGQLVLLLRGISLMTNTQFLSHYLTEIVLANYVDSCSDTICLLYEELMLPLPEQLSSPNLDTSHATSDGESPSCSVSKPLVTAATAESSSSACKLKRFKSFHGFPAAKKQITVPVEKKTKKAGKQYKSSSSITRSPFKVVRSPHKPPLYNKGNKNVRRSLFPRSKSMMTLSHHHPEVAYSGTADNPQEPSYRGIQVDNILCVQETPLKKQVPNYRQFKLQRARSKLSTASFPEIDSIQESPYRLVQPNLRQWVSPRRFIGSSSKGGLLHGDSIGQSGEVISSSGDEEHPSETSLMSLYLPPQAVATDQASHDQQHMLEIHSDSMTAFRLATPPKEAKLNFLNLTTSLK